MKLRSIVISMVIAIGLSANLNAQILIREDIKAFLENISDIPEGIDEFHQAYINNTCCGVKLNDVEILTPVFNQLKSWVGSIHEAVILKKIEDFPQSNMSFSIQFEDERLKLALRPLIGAAMLNNQELLKSLGRQNVEKLIALEKTFDWMQYYKAYEKIKKEYITKDAAIDSKSFDLEEKIPVVNTEWGPRKDPEKQRAVSNQLLKEKVQIELENFRIHQETWNFYFRKFKAALLQLHQLLEEFNYGENFSTAGQKILADIQARALEAVEKMVWKEFSLLFIGEMTWFDKEMAKHYEAETGK